MKNLNRFNLLVMLFPILFGLLILIDEGYIFYLLFSMIPLGLTQLVIAICLNSKKPRIENLKKYWVLVIVFFLIWILSSFLPFMLYSRNYILYGLPPIISIYFSLIIFNESKKQQS